VRDEDLEGRDRVEATVAHRFCRAKKALEAARILSGESEPLSRCETKQLTDLGAIDAVPRALHRRYISTAALDE